MKVLVASTLLFGTTAVAVAQLGGFVDFSNLTPAANAPVSDASGKPIIGGPYVADLFWSANTNAPMDALTPAGDKTPFTSFDNSGPGYFFGGAITFHSVYAGVRILVQVRAWDTTYGSSYYEARDNGGEFGFSNSFLAVPTVPPSIPWYLYGLQSFQLQRLPHLTIAPATTNTILLSWPVEVTTYAVQQSLDLSPTNWITLTNTPVVVGSQSEIILPNPPARMFYRLVSQ